MGQEPCLLGQWLPLRPLAQEPYLLRPWDLWALRGPLPPQARRLCLLLR